MDNPVDDPLDYLVDDQLDNLVDDQLDNLVDDQLNKPGNNSLIFINNSIYVTWIGD